MIWWCLSASSLGLMAGLWLGGRRKSSQLRCGAHDIPIQCTPGTLKPLVTVRLEATSAAAQVAVKKQKFSFTVDTGAAYTIIPKRLQRRFKIRAEKNNAEKPKFINLADGSSIPQSDFEWMKIRLVVDKEMLWVPCIIIKQTAEKKRACPTLLGRAGILDRFSLHIINHQGELRRNDVLDDALFTINELVRKYF